MPQRLELGTVVLNPLTHEVSRDGQLLDLSPTEFRLLQTLMERPNQLVSTRTLLQEVWGHTDMTARNVVRVTASRLRAKLEVDPSHPQYLQTVSGEGLIFRGEPPRPPITSARVAGPSVELRPVALDVVAELRELMGQMGTQPLQHLNDVFQQSSQNHLQGMRAALEEGDAEDLGREARSLRGASGSLGAQRMARVCATIEEQARAGDLGARGRLAAELEREMADFQEAIVPLLA